jgi:hypothetical protein
LLSSSKMWMGIDFLTWRVSALMIVTTPLWLPV